MEVAGLTISVKYYGLKTAEEKVIVRGIRGLLFNRNNGDYSPNSRVGWQLKFPEPVPLDSIFGHNFQNVAVNGRTIEIMINGIAYSINKINGALNYHNC